MDSLKETLMRRDGMTSDGADKEIDGARVDVAEGADPEEVDPEAVLADQFGLEPDYIFDLIEV